MSLSAVLVVVAACLAAVAVGYIVGLVLRIAARRRPYLATVERRLRTPLVLVLVSTAGLVSTASVELGAGLDVPVHHSFLVLLIGAVTWLLVRSLRVAEDAAFVRLRVDVADNGRARKLRTQIGVIRRIAASTLVVIGFSVALMTFPQMRAVGASILASAGLAGIIGGLAAQSTLGNVFAGLQLAFTDAIRLDDVVVVEGQWGRVDALTLTYVVVRIWDERRLVLPTTYFTTTPFENWTRTSTRIVGTVLLHLDYRTPLDELRAEAERLVRESPLWDGVSWGMQVTDCTDRTVEVRIVASASDGSRAWDLRCHLREALLTWVRCTHPEGLPVTRVHVPALATGGDSDPGG